MKNKFKDFFNYKIMVVPGTINSNTKTISALKSIIITITYTLLILGLSYIVFGYTPLNYYLPHQDVEGSREYQIKQLDEKVLKLLNEVEKLKTSNERLKKAILLADSNAFSKPGAALYENFNKNFLMTGSVFIPFKKFIYKFLFQNEGVSFIKPINGYISQEFNPDYGHYGIDFSAKVGSPVVAAANGYVVFADYTVNDGFMIILLHNEGYITVYKHCSAINKNIRDNVIQGELIALSGDTGRLSHGPHLHFEVWKDGHLINPKKLFIN